MNLGNGLLSIETDGNGGAIANFQVYFGFFVLAIVIALGVCVGLFLGKKVGV